MTLSSAQKSAVEEVLDAIVSTTAPRGKRHISAMFMELVDRADWPQYYEVNCVQFPCASSGLMKVRSFQNPAAWIIFEMG